MQKMNSEREQKYWKKLLGPEILQNLYPDVHLAIYDNKMEQEGLSVLYEIWNSEVLLTKQDELAGLFDNFYKWFLAAGRRYAEEKYGNLFEMCRDGTRIVADNIYNSIKEIPVRCLIEEISKCKEQHMLRGKDESEEYQFYNENMLGDILYVRALCEHYPELLRVLLLKIGWTVEELHRIIEAVLADKKQIITELCKSIPFQNIEKIETGLSDAHRCGKTVAKILLDNGITIIYKPRSLQKEKLYQQIYQWFCDGKNVSVCDYTIIDREKYGWEEEIQKESCHSQKEVQRYFYRIGIQLFICYFMNGSDLHGENMIAKGEFPVIVDMETFAGNRQRSNIQRIQGKGRQNVDYEIVSDFVRGSVLETGILPVPVWNTKEGGANVSALHRTGKVQTPFRVPVIKNGGTSKIEIAYQYGELELSDSVPDLSDREFSVVNVANEILSGFQDAYLLGLEKMKELEKLLQSVWEMDSRYVPRHTQQYSMYRFTSFHPDFMQSTEDRILFLNVLRKAQNATIYEKEIFHYEAESMLNADIPYFYCKGNSRSLFSGDGKEYPHFFEETSEELWKRKRKRLGKEDLERQMMLISYSVLLLYDGKAERRYQKINYGRIHSQKITDERRKRLLRKIADRICDLRLSNTDDKASTWAKVKFYKSKLWDIEPLGMNLYDGIPGIAVFFSALCKELPDEKYRRIYTELCSRMFRYTDGLLNQESSHEQKTMGAFIGESSVMRAYLLQWRISHNLEFLEYAKRHEQIVGRYLEGQNEADFLNGDAGLLTVYIEMYECTKQEKYLEKAVRLGEKLWKKVEKTEVGCGWKIEGENVPLAGMAHGNSGGIYAYALLLKYTHHKKYVIWIRELLKYENSLYSAEMKNWRDLRYQISKGKEEHNVMAWCHGTPGILLARLRLYTMSKFCRDADIKRDIERGIGALKDGRMPESICLCHGMAGNYLIIKKCAEMLSNQEMQRNSEILLQMLIDKLKNEDKTDANERYTVGLMCGISGVGYILCDDAAKIDIL